MTKSLKILLLTFGFALTACSTVRFGYEGETKDSKGETKVVRVEKSYPVGGAFTPLCYITAIAAGGSCWFFLVMPTVDQKQTLRTDAIKLAKKELGVDNVEFANEKIERVSWEQQEPHVSVRASE